MTAKTPMAKDGGRVLEVTRETARVATGSSHADLNLVLINQVAASLWTPAGTSGDDYTCRLQAALAALQGLAPRDELEGMLAVQMVATHSAAMECLRRAMIEEQSFEGRDQNLKHATKLLATYARQVEALDKHRGRGQQKITVEHVTVNAGGQAIVGSVGASAREPLALENKPGQTAPTLEPARVDELQPVPVTGRRS